ncbi:polymer-forming cytoskeletal protein [Kushneria aurantia]|uniref:Polymer-forming cytoskeletal protein n=1 Tax=Kushneria aurantia TaxID=504092 RepID=A0ABV6G331_9GAMM|nr:polymer-forming cytoskeletal protein [Kushneria aurantia]
MEPVQWLILLAAVAGVLILADGLRRARRTVRDEQQKHDRTAFGEDAAMPAVPHRVADEPAAPVVAADSDSLPLACSRIGPRLRVVGHIETAESLVVAGRVEGRIEADGQVVTLLQGASTGPFLHARQLIAAGHLSGRAVVTERASLLAGACCEGQLDAARLDCREGARLQGRSDVGEVDADRRPRKMLAKRQAAL